MKLIHHEERTREPVCAVIRRHNAYLIHWIFPESEERTEDENVDAAGSMAVARRVARAGLPAGTFIGPFRWTDENGLWYLHATYVNAWDEEDWSADDE